MRVAAWIPDKGENQAGVVIPKSALVWYMDQAFVYIKTAEEQFSRRSIDQYSATTGVTLSATASMQASRWLLPATNACCRKSLGGKSLMRMISGHCSSKR